MGVGIEKVKEKAGERGRNVREMQAFLSLFYYSPRCTEEYYFNSSVVFHCVDMEVTPLLM